MVKFKDFSIPKSVFKYFSRQVNFQGLFKTVLYIQVLFKPVWTLHTYSVDTEQVVQYLQSPKQDTLYQYFQGWVYNFPK